MCKLANPDYVILLKDCDFASSIMKFCKNNNIQNYAYAFVYYSPYTHKVHYLKFGRSAGEEIGERIYRQAGHIHGWDKMLQGSSGSDMKDVITLFENENNFETPTVEHIAIHIWNVTQHKNPHINDIAYPSRICENELMTEYEAVFNKLPVGNLKDTRHEMMQPYVSKDTWNNLFDDNNG